MCLIIITLKLPYSINSLWEYRLNDKGNTTKALQKTIQPTEPQTDVNTVQL